MENRKLKSRNAYQNKGCTSVRALRVLVVITAIVRPLLASLALWRIANLERITLMLRGYWFSNCLGIQKID